MNKLFDVIAVNLDTNEVRRLDTGKTEENAEAFVKMAIMRRGLEEEFFTTVPTDTYKDGDTYSN